MKTFGSKPGYERDRQRDRLLVGVSDYVVAADGETLVAYGLGACVAVALYDPESSVGALCHSMLPQEPTGGGATGKYVDAAIEAMLQEMVSVGAGYGSVHARIVGGADVFAFAELADRAGEAGARNVQAARATLDRLGVEVVGDAVGGDHGRTAEFNTETGEVRVVTATKEEGVI